MQNGVTTTPNPNKKATRPSKKATAVKLRDAQCLSKQLTLPLALMLAEIPLRLQSPLCNHRY